MDPLVKQLQAFAVTLMAGVAAGFCYDYYRELRRQLRLKRMGTVLGDLLFWLLLTALVFGMLLWGNWGEVRFYVFIGGALGALCYYWMFSRLVRKIINFKFFAIVSGWQLLVKITLFLYGILLFPIQLAHRLLSYPWNFIKKTLSSALLQARVFFYNKAGRKIEQALNRLKSGLSAYAFWKKKN